MARVGCWNHNVQYQPVILGAVPGVRYRRHLLWRYSRRKPSG